MVLAVPPRSTAAELLRLCAAWLAAVLLVQGLAAGLALGAGPLHRHAGGGPARTAHDALHRHDAAERHHHRADEPGLVAQADAGADAASLALVAALALLAFAARRLLADPRRHARPDVPPFAWRSTAPTPLLRPPRRG
jgi:hypothetical protein